MYYTIFMERFCFLYNSRKEYNRAIRRIDLFPLESAVGFLNLIIVSCTADSEF